MRARGIDNSKGRQDVLSELYQKFFRTAVKKDAERLGIVYTPEDVVDFILHSANDVLQEEFGRSLSDEDVHILDPFTGTGTFLVRLLQSDLIRDSDLERKYRHELHANEIVLLAYYMAAVNIEEAYRGRRGEDSDYEPFGGIVLTDTFNLNEWQPSLAHVWMPDNNARVERQQKLPIQVIVGNPPWSAGQKSGTDDNPNVNYPSLEQRVEETYAEYVTVTNKRHLYDTYKMAVRWASDRIEGQGIIAFITNGAWIDGSADAGMRACLAQDFSSIYVLNLRGSTRTSRVQAPSEGGPVFGQSTRSRVTITILVKNTNAANDRCHICYRDIGDHLSREEKLETLREARSISGFTGWQEVMPDEHHDWIKQRNPAYVQFYPIGSKEAKAGVLDDSIFGLYSLGLVTNRDAYIYNFSREACRDNAQRMTEDYLSALTALEGNSLLSLEDAMHQHSSNLKWVGNLKDNLRQKKKTEYQDGYIRKVTYRPFVATHCYANYIFVHRKHQMDRIFPDSSSVNRMICATGIGSRKPFSVLMTGTITDLNLHEAGAQCFPRYRYPKPVNTSDITNTSEAFIGMEPESERTDNISDTALCVFRNHYRDNTITKDAIFNYVYGILHSSSYREEFANDLLKEIPRIPFAPDFCAFAQAGKALAELHLRYETCERYSLGVEFTQEGEPEARHFRLTDKAMRFADDEKRTLVINEHVSLSGIPEAAHGYVVNDRTPLEWYIDRYKIKRDKESSILNDPNGWFEDPRDLLAAIERIVYVSVESTRIIEGLPSELTDDSQA